MAGSKNNPNPNKKAQDLANKQSKEALLSRATRLGIQVVPFQGNFSCTFTQDGTSKTVIIAKDYLKVFLDSKS